MEVKESAQEEIIKSISEIGTNGATILEIEKRVKFERHTLSKYLSFMQGNGLICHRMYGKAKVWFINKAPIETAFNSPDDKKTFSEKILTDLISVIPYGLVIIDKEYNILFLNPEMVQKYGNLTGQKFYQSIIGDVNPLKLKPITDIIWGKAKREKFEITDGLGNIIVINASALVNPDKSLSVLILIADVTERRKSEQMISEQNALLKAERDILDKSAIISETDLKGNITYANENFCKISKYSLNELVGKNHRIVNSGFHPKSFFSEIWKTIETGKIWRGEIKNRAKDGSYYWVDSSIAPVIGKNGKPAKYISIRYDITKLKKSEKPKKK